MAKVAVRSSFRVVAIPKTLYDFGIVRLSDNHCNDTDAEIERRYEERCEEIARSIERHVDNVDSVAVVCDTHYVCSHCFRNWTVAGETELHDPKLHGHEWERWFEGEPQCCDAASDDWRVTNGIKPWNYSNGPV